MSRPRGSIIGAKPTWTTTATSGIWTLRQAEEMQADGKWPRGPEAPTSLAGTAGDEEVALTWTAPATTHGTITDYIVEYTPAAGSPTVVATGSTAASYTLTGLTNDTEYTFRVAAVNHTRGDWSDSVAVTPAAPPQFASYAVTINGSTTHPVSGTYDYSGEINGKPYWTRTVNGSPSGYISYWFNTWFYDSFWQVGPSPGDSGSNTWFYKSANTATPTGLTAWNSYGYGGDFALTEIP